MAARFGIAMGEPTAAERPAHLLEAAYGQAHVVASPYRMARVAAAIANGGLIPSARWTMVPPDSGAPATAMSAATAGALARLMRGVVERGTAKRLAAVTPAIAGKTGTAQVVDEPSHSWFVGYAPYGPAARRIAFAVLVENGGYGGVRAAQVAGDVVATARDLGLAVEELR
jgi:cell division protein FtsI/penicillin-binding protein 2